MKRSEVITKLVESIELMRGVDNGYYVYPEDNIIANIILSKLEEMEILPPNSTTAVRPYHDLSVRVMSRREWETE